MVRDDTWGRCGAVLGGLMLCMSALWPAAGAAQVQPLAALARTGQDGFEPPWREAGLPSQRLPATRFTVEQRDGRTAVRIEARGAYGNLVHPLGGAAGVLSWQWQVERFVDGADLRTREADDTSVKVCALFDMPIERVPFLERQLLRLARARTAEPLPAATLCYVRDPAQHTGTWLDNAYSRRVRYLVLRGAGDEPGLWQAESRDLAADFAQAFGGESTEVPPLLAIAFGADTDNTGGHAVSRVAGLRHAPATGARP